MDTQDGNSARERQPQLRWESDQDMVYQVDTPDRVSGRRVWGRLLARQDVAVGVSAEHADARRVS